MKLTTALTILSLGGPFTHAAPQTRYSTVTVIPLPLSATVIHYHPTGSFYPTGSNRPSLFNGYYNAPGNISLSYTLSYPTTDLPPTSHIFAKRPTQSSISAKLLPCTPNELYCNSKTSFSLCVPGTEGGSQSVFMGAVADGTFCDGGRIKKAAGGDCSPVGDLKCQGERGFFLCDEGMFVF